jgi:uncharacterized protein
VNGETRHAEFEWDDTKAASNERKHGVSFKIARTVFFDAAVVTFFDAQHSEQEERWYSIGRAETGRILTVVYTWTETDQDVVLIRIVSARKATRPEISLYQEQIS